MGARRPERPSKLVEAAALLIDYAFATWTFRKIYTVAIAGEDNFPFASGLDGLLHEEGRLRDHALWRHSFHDQVTSAIYRADWARFRPLLLRFLAREPDSTATPCSSNSAVVGSAFEEFLELLEGACPLLRHPRGPSDRLAEDLRLTGLDLELVAASLRVAGGAELPNELLAEIQTIGDLHHYFELQRRW